MLSTLAAETDGVAMLTAAAVKPGIDRHRPRHERRITC